MLASKVALVTGASRGIGKAIAHALGKEGAFVAGTATTQAGADQISTTFQQAGIKGNGFVLDVAHDESIETVFKQITEQFAAPLIVVNNAGITRDNLVLRMKANEWDEVIQTNLTAIFKVSRISLKHMLKAQWGRIISISSLVGLAGNPGQANYAAAKAGMIGYSKSLALEVGSRGITVNVVAPGLIETDMANKLNDQQRDNLISQVPSKRLGTAEEVAASVAFLASPLASYINGITLHVNGGMYMA